MKEDELIAKICHEVTNAYRKVMGEDTVPWDDTKGTTKTTLVKQVAYHRKYKTSPEQMHESWLQAKEQDGWKLGDLLDFETKTHPCMVPYDELPIDQRVKDHLLVAVVDSISSVISEFKPQIVKNDDQLCVQYVGRRADHHETLYGTNTVWKKGEVKSLPADISKKMCREHPDVYALYEQTVDPSEVVTEDDIEKEEKEKPEEQEAALTRRKIQTMTRKQDVIDWIERNNPGYKISLKSTSKLSDFQDLAINLFDRFGAL